MIISPLDLLFGCWHRRLSFPQSRRGAGASRYASCHCLDCGRGFVYDWQEMRALTYRQLEKRLDKQARAEAVAAESRS